jgi:hypothetical protein
MFSRSPTSTRIHTLQVRAPQHLQSQLQRELALADWPETSSERIIFIRRLEVSANADEISERLCALARQHIERLDPGSNAKSFSCQSTMLAELLLDAARGDLVRHWYWRKWHQYQHQPRSAAIRQICEEFPASVGHALSILCQRNQVAQFMQQLSGDDCVAILATVSASLGYSHPSERIMGSAHLPVSPEILQTINRHIPHPLAEQWRRQVSLFQCSIEHCYLIAFILAQQFFPLMLLQSPDETLSMIGLTLLRSPADIKADINRQFVEYRSNDSRLPDISERSEKLAGEGFDASPRSVLNEPGTAPVHPRATISLDSTIPPPSDTTYSEQHASHQQAAEESENEPLALPEWLNSIDEISYPQFFSRRAGVFFLLNFLNRTPIQNLMRDQWAELPNGWCWLLGLAELLERPELFCTDPVYHFIRAQAGLEPSMLSVPLPDQGRLLETGREFYGDELWNSDLFELHADIRDTPGQITISAAIESASVVLRLAGLDHTPGWLPWLGQVVRINFEPGYSPGRSQP